MEYLHPLGGPGSSREGRSSAPGSTIDQIASTWPQGSMSLAKGKTEVAGEWILAQPVSKSTPATSTCILAPHRPSTSTLPLLRSVPLFLSS